MLESLIDFSQLVRPKRPALSYVVLEIQNHRESGHAMWNEWINNFSSLYYGLFFNFIIESKFDLVAYKFTF